MGGDIIIPIAVAHDSTCDKGDEWFFDGLNEDNSIEDSQLTEEAVEEAVEDSKIGCALFCIMLLVGIGFGIYYLITH